MFTRSGKTWTKALSLLLAAFLLLALAAGCSAKTAASDTGSPEAAVSEDSQQAASGDAEEFATAEGVTPEPGAKLKIWGPDPANGNDSSGQWLQDMAKEFEEKYGVPFVFEPINATDSPGKLAQDGPAKQGADVFFMAHDHLGEVVAAGLVYPNEATDASQFLESAITACSSEGKLYGYPTAIETYGLFYNKKLIDKAPATYQEIIDFAKTFNDVKNKKFGLMIEPDNFYFSYQYLAGYGGYVFGKDGTDPDDIGLNNEGAIEGAKFLQSLKEILPVNSGDITGDVRDGLFKEGKLAMQVSGPWSVQPYTEAGVEFGVTPLPLLPNGKNPVSFSGVRALYINSYTDYPVASRMFAEYCVTKESLVKLYKTAGHIPPRKDLMEDPDLKADPYTTAFLQQAQYSQPMPSIPQMGAVWAQGKTALASIWNNNTDPRETLDNAVKLIKETAVQTTK